MTVRRLLREMDSRELTEWIAYDCIDRIGDQRGDERNAILCQLVASIGGKPPKLEAFMPYPLEESKPVKQSGKEQASILAAFARGLA
jgi:hypothetical protein